MTRRERLERKVEKRRDWADKAKARSDQRLEAARNLADSIPLGQPLLVDHHSYKHALADQKRIHNNMNKGMEQRALAQTHESKADGLESQLERAVFSDDDNAIEALEARIAERTAELERRKAINKEIRRGEGWEARLSPPLTDAEKAELLSLARAWAGVYKPGYPPYAISNLGAAIRKDRERIEEIKRRIARTEKAEVNGGVVVEGNEWVRVTFADKPERSVLDALKAAGFRWGGGSWVGERAKLPEGIAPA